MQFFVPLRLSLIASCITVATLCADEQAEKAIKRVNNHLVIHDYSNAVSEARQALLTYPTSAELWQAYICALSKTEDEKEMMTAWNLYAANFPQPYDDHEVIEAMAWGVINNASATASPLTRLFALLGAFLSQDAKGVNVIYKHMHDKNSSVRAVAVELAGQMRDAKLIDGVQYLFNHEKIPRVRVAVIEALGSMKIVAAKPDLVAIVASQQSSAEEKATAIQALVELLDTVDTSEIQSLATSNRAGLRLVACRLVAHLDLKQNLEVIYPLLKDSCSEVRGAAIAAFGSIQAKEYKGQSVAELAAAMLKDNDPKVAITAAWVLTLNDSHRGQDAFKSWLTHDKQDLRLLAAGALSGCGRHGLPLAQEAFEQAQDPYVKMNLAIGLIGQRVEIEPACACLCNGLSGSEDRWTWTKHGNFRSLVPSRILAEELSLDSPIAVNLETRLDVLNIVATMEYGKAQEALAQSFEHRQWGIAGNAAALLLTEGDEAALDLVRNLLNSPKDIVRVQAALILAIWGREEQVITMLQDAYSNADRELKEHILEGIGRVGAQSSIPFLVARLQEPSQYLRIYAASALLQTLYH